MICNLLDASFNNSKKKWNDSKNRFGVLNLGPKPSTSIHFRSVPRLSRCKHKKKLKCFYRMQNMQLEIPDVQDTDCHCKCDKFGRTRWMVEIFFKKRDFTICLHFWLVFWSVCAHHIRPKPTIIQRATWRKTRTNDSIWIEYFCWRMHFTESFNSFWIFISYFALCVQVFFFIRSVVCLARPQKWLFLCCFIVITLLKQKITLFLR